MQNVEFVMPGAARSTKCPLYGMFVEFVPAGMTNSTKCVLTALPDPLA